MESKELLRDFTAYCKAHPQERFWQALRNWSGYTFIMAAHWRDKSFDTFYWKSKDGKCDYCGARLRWLKPCNAENAVQCKERQKSAIGDWLLKINPLYRELTKSPPR